MPQIYANDRQREKERASEGGEREREGGKERGRRIRGGGPAFVDDGDQMALARARMRLSFARNRKK